jgi:hypothetical protein
LILQHLHRRRAAHAVITRRPESGPRHAGLPPRRRRPPRRSLRAPLPCAAAGPEAIERCLTTPTGLLSTTGGRSPTTSPP